MSVSQAVRFAVFERDGFRCQYCGATPKEALLHVDHIIPVSLDGGDGMDNLRTACVDCNTGKAGKPLAAEDSLDDLKRRKELLSTRRKLLASCAKEAAQIIEEKERIVWVAVRLWQSIRGEEHKDGKMECSHDLFCRLASMLARYDFQEVADAIEIALGNQRTASETVALKYLYGVLRNRVGAREDGVPCR